MTPEQAKEIRKKAACVSQKTKKAIEKYFAFKEGLPNKPSEEKE